MPATTSNTNLTMMRLLLLHPLLLASPLLARVPFADAASSNRLGGEFATLDNNLFSYNISHRQDVCGRYLDWRKGKVELRDALSGLALRPLMAMGDFFEYSYETGIDAEAPGLMAELMDALAESANFTWRSSFGVMEKPEDLNRTWTEMLLWGIETYDIAVNWWDQSVERMEKGAAYVEPWFDGSVILIDEEDPPEIDDKIDLLNWLKPYEPSVWLLIVVTILLSALAYQFIEFLTDEREERPMSQWFSDNLYLSCLNFTQNFEYAPNTVAGRIFGVSMGIWALVITATYTANLASLFVEEQRPALVVDSIDQAVALGIPICTYKNTNADFIIKRRYENAIRVPKGTELQAYQALKRGECQLVAGYLDNWKGYEQNTKYNPDCDLDWVGRTVEVIKSGFAVKADAGYLCSSLIREVMNIHMTSLISEGVLEEVWEKHRAKTADQNCALEDPSQVTRRQRHLAQQSSLRSSSKDQQQSSSRQTSAGRRKLKGSKSSAAASSGTTSSGLSLTLKQMMGTFFLHWVTTIVAILVAVCSKYNWFRLNTMKDSSRIERVVYRKHGPIVGVPPPMNTYKMTASVRNLKDAAAPPMNTYKMTASVRNLKDAAAPLHDRRVQFANQKTADSSDDHEQHPGDEDVFANEETFANDNLRAEELPPADVAKLRAELQETKKELDDKMNLVLSLLHNLQPPGAEHSGNSDEELPSHVRR